MNATTLFPYSMDTLTLLDHNPDRVCLTKTAFAVLLSLASIARLGRNQLMGCIIQTVINCPWDGNMCVIKCG